MNLSTALVLFLILSLFVLAIRYSFKNKHKCAACPKCNECSHCNH